MLVHKGCKELAKGKNPSGFYILASITVAMDPYGTPSSLGGVEFSVSEGEDYNGTAYVDSIECYDCGNTIFTLGGIESYKLEHRIDADPAFYNLEERNV